MVWVLAGLGVVGVALFLKVDDWSRDFSTNVASTRHDPGLTPLRLDGSVDQAVDLLRQTIAQMPRWRWIGQSPAADDHSAATIDLVRSTPLFRFKDDVRVTIEGDRGPGVVIHVQSRSRIGKGDLGQNPRNIKELLRRLETVAK